MTQPTKRPRSAAAFDRACRVIPGGVNSPARAFGGVGGQPPFIARGDGPFIYDIDGNQYLDYVGSWGPLILGHCHPACCGPLRKPCAKAPPSALPPSWKPNWPKSSSTPCPRLKWC